MSNILIVSGKAYIDIDALACAVAYSEYLNRSNRSTSINLSTTLNESITPTVRSWLKDRELSTITNTNQIIVVDVSEPGHIDPNVDQEHIIELFDHHFGYGDYWKKRLGSNSHIEDVGACATLIYEQIEDKLTEISSTSIDLLFTAVLSNTLNLKAQITKNRDREAVNTLRKISKLPNNWAQVYYGELEKNIFENPKQAIANDIKVQNIKGTEYVISQIELWDSEPFLKQNEAIIKNVLGVYNTANWFYTSPSIGEGKNYLYCEDDRIKDMLSNIIGAEFHGNTGSTSELWLRKEIIREIQNKSTQTL